MRLHLLSRTLLAVAFLAKGDRDIARKYLSTVVDVDPVSPEAGQAAALLQQIGK